MPKTKKEHTLNFYVRVDAVVNILLENPKWLESKRSRELHHTVRKRFDIQSTQATKYIAEARKVVAQITKDDTETNYKYIREKLFALISKAGKSSEYFAELAALKEFATITGVRVEKQKVEVENIKGSVTIVLPDNGRDNINGA